MTNTTVDTPVSYHVVPYSDLQATSKLAYQTMALQKPRGLFHSYSLPSVTVVSSAVQCVFQHGQEEFVSIAPIQN